MPLTLEEVDERYGGVLPPGETLARDKPTDVGRKSTNELKARPPPGKQERWSVFNAFVDASMMSLNRSELAVWLVLFRDTKGDTGLARTGQTDLARRCGCSVRAVRTAIQSLQDKGFIEVVRLGRINAGPSVYRVKLPG